MVVLKLKKKIMERKSLTTSFTEGKIIKYNETSKTNNIYSQAKRMYA